MDSLWEHHQVGMGKTMGRSDEQFASRLGAVLPGGTLAIPEGNGRLTVFLLVLVSCMGVATTAAASPVVKVAERLFYAVVGSAITNWLSDDLKPVYTGAKKVVRKAAARVNVQAHGPLPLCALRHLVPEPGATTSGIHRHSSWSAWRLVKQVIEGSLYSRA